MPNFNDMKEKNARRVTDKKHYNNIQKPFSGALDDAYFIYNAIQVPIYS